MPHVRRSAWFATSLACSLSLTDILAGAAIITSGVTLYFTLKGSGKGEPKPAATFIAPRGVAVGLGPGRLLLQGGVLTLKSAS